MSQRYHGTVMSYMLATKRFVETPMHAITYAVLPGELVIDVGANLGDKAEWFANRGVRVIAVEPQPKLVEALRKRFAKNLLVTVVPKGLAAQPGGMIMNISEDHVISTFSDEWKTGRFRNHTWGTKEKIEVTTLDTLIEQFGQPRYIKIDVEGFERQSYRVYLARSERCRLSLPLKL